MKELNLIPEKTALVAIDFQQGVINGELKPYSSQKIVENASKLIKKFIEKGAFVALVRVSTDGKDFPNPKADLENNILSFPEGWDKYIPEIENIKGAHFITKKQWGAFHGTGLDLQLRRRGIDTIVLCGAYTGIGVDTTAREAFQHGYHQIFAEDAMGSISKEEHDYVCENIFPKIGKVRLTNEILSSLK